MLVLPYVLGVAVDTIFSCQMISEPFCVFLKRERVQTARCAITRISRASQRKIPPLKPSGAVGDAKYALTLVSSWMASHKTPLTRSVSSKISFLIVLGGFRKLSTGK
jgi:hypothetical protein